MVNEVLQFELKKHGSTNNNIYWAYGTLRYGIFTYTGLVQFVNEYQLTDGSIYQVSSISTSFSKKGNFKILLALA